MFFCQRVQAIHIHRQTRQVDRNDGLGTRCDGGFYLSQVDIAGDRIDVGEHRRGAGFNNHVGCGNPGNRRGDDFIASADAGDAQGDFHGAGAGIEGAHRTAAEIFGQLRFECLHLGAAGNPAGT